jgi:hypothetical protein
MREILNAYETLIGKPEGKRPLARSKRRLMKYGGRVWSDFIKIGTSGRLWRKLR